MLKSGLHFVVSIFFINFAAMKEKIIKTPSYDRVCLINSRGNSVSSLMLHRENFNCYYKQLNGLMKPNGSVLYLCDFGTNYKYRKHGYARRILEYTLKAYENDIIYLGVKSGDPDQISDRDLIKFYKSVGFKKINYKLPYTFMVYDRFNKLPYEAINEKVIKFVPNRKDICGNYIVDNMPEPYIKKNGNLVKVVYGKYSLLKSKMHRGYSKLFLTRESKDDKTGDRSYEMSAVYDKDCNEVLIKYAHDCISAYMNFEYNSGKRKYELQIQTDYGVE